MLAGFTRLVLSAAPGRMPGLLLGTILAALTLHGAASARTPAGAASSGGAVLVPVQAQIIPLSDTSLAHASAGALPTPLATARAPDRVGVTLWDEVRIQPPALGSASGVLTITVNGK